MRVLICLLGDPAADLHLQPASFRLASFALRRNDQRSLALPMLRTPPLCRRTASLLSLTWCTSQNASPRTLHHTLVSTRLVATTRSNRAGAAVHSTCNHSSGHLRSGAVLGPGAEGPKRTHGTPSRLAAGPCSRLSTQVRLHESTIAVSHGRARVSSKISRYRYPRMSKCYESHKGVNTWTVHPAAYASYVSP